jgi:hypothetical protein
MFLIMNQIGRSKSLEEDEITLKEILKQFILLYKFLLKKWLIIIIPCLIGGLLGLGYAFYKKPLYKAQLSFALEDEKSSGGLSSALGLASQFGIDLGGTGGGAFSGDNLLELIKSRSIVERTLLKMVNINGKKQTLAEMYIDFNNMRKLWAENPQTKNVKFEPNANRASFTLQQDSILGEIHHAIVDKNLNVDKIDKKLSIITVTVKSENQLFSKFFTELLVNEVSTFYIDTKTKKSTQNVNILQYQTDSVRHELNSAISGVASSIDATPNPNALKQILRVPSQKRQVDVQANQAILTELVKNLELSKMSLRKETPLIQIIDSPILPLEKEKLSKLKAMVLGGIVGIILATIFLVVKRTLGKILYD